MRLGARVIAALLVVASSTMPGLGIGASAAAAVPVPAGGCWAYAPSAAELASLPASNISTTLEPWTTVADGGFALDSGGSTVVGGKRTATVRIASGPVVSTAQDITGTASFLLSVDGQPLLTPVAVSFTAAAGDPVTDLVATTELPAPAAGSHTLRLDAVYFDVPSLALRVACNGQLSGLEAGPNPATAPVPTDLNGSFTTLATASVGVTSVEGQQVLDTARPGDVVSVSLSGFASGAPVNLQLCSMAGLCAAVGNAMAGPDGSGAASFAVPGFAPVGPGTLRVDDGITQSNAGFSVLGVQVVAAAEELTTDSTAVTLSGSGWDPQRPVTIRGYAGTNSSTQLTSDPAVIADVDAAGEFVAQFDVADESTESVIVEQVRTSGNIGSVYLISGVIGGAIVDPGENPDPEEPGGETETPDGTDTDNGTSTGPGTSPGTTGVAAPPLTTPLDIPLPVPGEVEVVEPPVETAVPPGLEDLEDLKVSEVRLDGQVRMAELFGGSPRRDLIFVVTNVGETDVSAPLVRVSVGRSDDVEPQVVDVEVGDLAPGQQSVVSVPLALPMAAFGDYVVVGQVGDTEAGGFAQSWTTYPSGLFVLNALALVLLGWGVTRRMALRRQPAGALALALPADQDAVVDLTAADAWWASRRGAAAPGSPAAGDEDAIIDLDAAEKWWGRASRVS